MMPLTLGQMNVGWIKIFVLLLSILNTSTSVNGLQFEYYPNDDPLEGDDCRTPAGESGVCKYISHCEAFTAKTVDYYSLGHCTYVGFSQVICCPTTTMGWSRNIVPAMEKPFEKTTTRSPVVNSIERAKIEAHLGDISRWLFSKKTETQTERTSNGVQAMPYTMVNSPTIELPSILGTTVPTKSSTLNRVDNRFERPSQAACQRYKERSPAAIPYNNFDRGLVARSSYVGLMYLDNNRLTLCVRCGSSLISERYVLTAAHCVKEYNPIVARLGAAVRDAINGVDILPLEIEIENATMYPDCSFKSLYHDIALIRLKRDVEMTPHISPACLYSESSDIDSTASLAVIGWNDSNEAMLWEKRVTTLPLNICNCSYLRFGVSRKLISGIKEGQYCVLDPDLRAESCESDPGGPLMLVEDKVSAISTIVGVVSFGYLCGSEVPSVYTRVANYLDWIEAVVWPSQSND